MLFWWLLWLSWASIFLTQADARPRHSADIIDMAQWRADHGRWSA